MTKSVPKWLTLVGVAAVGAGSLFAQDSKALIDVLIRKGILTPEEARQLQAEAKRAESPVKTTVSGKLYVDVSSIDAETASGTKVNPSGLGLDVKRFYLDVNHQFDSVWSADIKLDAGYSSSTGTVASFIKTAFIQAKISPELAIRAGASDMPWIPFDEGLYTYRYVENTLIDRLHFGNSADWGLHVLGKNGIVSYAASIVNGGGYKNPTRSKGMDVAGRLSIEPAKGLTFAVGGYSGKLGKDSYSAPATRTASRYDLLVNYAGPQFSLGAEYFSENDWGYTASASSDKGDGYSVFAKAKLSDPWWVFGRWDDVKTSKTLHPDMKENYFNVGIEWVAIKGVNLALVYKYDHIDNPASATQTAKYDEVGLFAQAAF